MRAIDQVTSVKSLTAGPKSFQDAMQSPFWHRLLIADNGKSSNLVVFVEHKNTKTLVRRLEHLIDEFDQADFRIHIAGTPYVVE